MQDYIQPLANGEPATNIAIHSGFPNPAADQQDRKTALALDLNQLLVRHPSSTYLFRISGDTWAERGIFDGDIAIIDRALHPQKYDTVLTWQADQFNLTSYDTLDPHHPWGVVSAIIHPRTQTERNHS